MSPHVFYPKSVIMNLTYTFAINELLSIEKEGTVSLMAGIYLKWYEPRFRWQQNSSLLRVFWKWSEDIDFLARNIWIPNSGNT